MPNITPDMIIADVLRMDEKIAPIFLNSGMHCIGCPSSSGESIEEACKVHGIDANNLVKELNDYFKNA